MAKRPGQKLNTRCPGLVPEREENLESYPQQKAAAAQRLAAARAARSYPNIYITTSSGRFQSSCGISSILTLPSRNPCQLIGVRKNPRAPFGRFSYIQEIRKLCQRNFYMKPFFRKPSAVG